MNYKNQYDQVMRALTHFPTQRLMIQKLDFLQQVQAITELRAFIIRNNKFGILRFRASDFNEIIETAKARKILRADDDSQYL